VLYAVSVRAAYAVFALMYVTYIVCVVCTSHARVLCVPRASITCNSILYRQQLFRKEKTVCNKRERALLVMGSGASIETCAKKLGVSYEDEFLTFLFDERNEDLRQDVSAEKDYGCTWLAYFLLICQTLRHSLLTPSCCLRVVKYAGLFQLLPKQQAALGCESFVAPDALDFRRLVFEKQSSFFPGTREWVFSRVTSWLNSEQHPSQLFWLQGAGGTGKSVVSAEFIKRLLSREHALSENVHLAAWHFCRHDGKRCLTSYVSPSYCD